jgi:hypothetical protein
MSSPWIQHVKNTQHHYGVSYKEAMQIARETYNPQHGGSFKSVMGKAKKATKQAKKASQFIDNNAHLIDQFDKSGRISEANNLLKRGINIADNLDGQLGGNFKLKNAVRKARNTARTVSHAVDKYAPLVEMVAPELAPAIEGFHAANAIYKKTGGSVGRRNKYIEMMGGSFSVPRHGGSFNVPTHSGGGGFVQNGLISASPHGTTSLMLRLENGV